MISNCFYKLVCEPADLFYTEGNYYLEAHITFITINQTDRFVIYSFYHL